MIGLVTRLPPAALPIRLLIICVGVMSAALFRFVVLPDTPAEELVRLRRDAWRGIARLLAHVEAAIGAGAWTRSMRQELQREQDRLGMMALMAQTRIWAMSSPPPGAGLHLLELELAVERVAHVALHDLGTGSERSRLRIEVAALRAALNGARAPEMIPDSSSRLGHALASLAQVLHEPPEAAGFGPEPPPPAAATSGLRVAVQAGVATALAIGVGELVSTQRWYWAAFSAFAMFQGTRSRGESIAKELQFMAGTLAGVFAAVLLAAVLNGHELLTMTVIVVAVFLAWQAFLAAYAVMIFWITIILGLLFGLLGYFPPALLLLRLEETAAGALCGILVACVVMTRPTRETADEATIAVLRAIGQAVDAATRLLLGERTDPRLPSALIEVERRFAELRDAARPELQGLGIARHNKLRRRIILLGSCIAWTREVGRIGLSGARLADPTAASAARVIVREIDRTVAQLTDRPPGLVLADADVNPQPGGGVGAPHAIRVLHLIDLSLKRSVGTIILQDARPVADVRSPPGRKRNSELA